MREIEVIQAEHDAAADRHRELARELREALRAAAPVHVGDIVRWADKTWRQHKLVDVVHESLVTHVRVRSYGCDYEGRRRNKNGSWSKAVTHIYAGSNPEIVGHEDV